MTLRHPIQGGHRGAGGAFRWLLLGSIILILVVLTARVAVAENLGPGGSRLITGDEMVGPYRLLITSSPNPATTGTVTFVVRVSDPQSGAKVRDAQVEIELTSTDGSTVLKQPATHQNAGNEIDYAAHIPVPQDGAYNGVVRVNGSLGSSAVRFVQTVAPQRSLSTVILVGVPFVAMLGVLGAMFYLRSGSRKTEPARQNPTQNT